MGCKRLRTLVVTRHRVVKLAYAVNLGCKVSLGTSRRLKLIAA